MDVLESALERCKNSAPGLDNIPYLFLKKLTASSKRTLLFFYNYVFSSNSFPSPWKLATVIPVYKEGKEGRFPKSYRPISLTNCICKVMERMVSNRLNYFIESKNLLSPHQFGFREGHSTAEPLVILEHSIQDAFLEKKIVMAVFFDIKNAYDMVWRWKILEKLYLWELTVIY